MVATFDQTLSTPTDRIRAQVGDRDVPDNALRQDEEYEATYQRSGGDERLATALIAEGLAAEYCQRVDAFSESGGISVRWGDRVKTWLALAGSIRDGLALAAGGAGGVSGSMVRAPGTGWASEYVRDCRPSCGGRTWWTE